MHEWTQLGVVDEGGALEVHGSNIWSGKSMSLNAPPVRRQHPAFAGQIHTFRLYRFANDESSCRVPSDHRRV
jgi:hypothetical protein